MKKGDIKIGKNGIKYQLVKRLGKGGQAEVWKAKNTITKVFYAYKEYRHNTNNIKANIEDLIKIGKFYDKNQKPLDEVVLPITVVEIDGDAFGYIMDLVDLQDYTVIAKAWSNPNKYPSCSAICIIMQAFARVFETLHNTYGMCYKDVNEGNIFFNPKNGSIKIIDNDNIGYASRSTIRGTMGYRAPEVVLGALPDHNSDRFSLAVFAYRLLTGGYPFDGPWTDNYCLKKGVTLQDAEKVVYGSHAVFSWNPNDKRNSFENTTDPKLRGQAVFWLNLPDSIKGMFLSTFAINLSEDRRAERTTDSEWREEFGKIEKKLVKCPRCGKITFSESGQCFECSGALNVITPGAKGNSVSGHKHKVTMKVLSAGEAKREMDVYVADIIVADKISKNLPSGSVFKILYNKKEKKVGIKNLSAISWVIVHADQTKEKCEPGQIQVLEEGMMIRIIPKTAQLNIVELQ